MDKKDLKIQALTERVAQLTADYESTVADLRVELTLLAHELGEIKKKEEETE